MNKIKVFLYTARFPFGNMSEMFLGSELKWVNSEKFEIHVIPLHKDKTIRQIPDYITLERTLCDFSFIKRFKAFLRSLTLGSLRLINWPYFTSSFKYLLASNMIYEDVKERASIENRSIFYSYWISFVPIAFVQYRLKHISNHIFIARGHGSDIYASDIGVHYPARELVMNNLDGYFIISEYGIDFLKKKYVGIDKKVYLSRLGVDDNYSEKKKVNTVIRFVSCSSIISIKRVDLIFKSIWNYSQTKLDNQFEWIHFGDGPLRGVLEQCVSESTQGNMNVVLKGECSNEEILNYYRNNTIHGFVLLSTTEGIPVSIMEAISSGIPVIATDVGGVKEIVTEETGVLLKQNFTQEEFNKGVDIILRNNDLLSKSAHVFYLENYNAKHNYLSFYESLERIYNGY